ncbi:MAG: hypothetical protein U1D30_25510 [Planctomycetota bacterium]
MSTLFPEGFLYEELEGGRGIEGPTPRNPAEKANKTSGRKRKQGAPSEQPADSSPFVWPWNTLINTGLEPPLELVRGTARAELYGLEGELAAVYVEGKRWDPSPWIARLSHWCAENVTGEGIVESDPWNVQKYWPALFRLRFALIGVEWPDDLECVLGKVHEMVLRTGWSRGWLFGEGNGLSKNFLQVLSEYRPPANPERWGAARRLLWLGEKTIPRGVRGPDPGVQSDESLVSVLRQQWLPSSALLAVDHRTAQIRTELRIFQELLWTGPWKTEIRVGEKLLQLKNFWEPTCWFQDVDGEYLELRLKLSAGVVLERQIFLPRERPFLWLSDTLKTEKADRLALSWTLPTLHGARAIGSVTTTAQTIKGYPIELRLLPVGEPANPLSPGTGHLTVDDRGLSIHSERTADRLFLPVVLTWARRSLPQQAEWRHLTITNDRRTVPVDEAVAFRIPIGDSQVLFFRALKTPMRYAFVGHQTYSECEIGHIDREGKFHEWLTVEGG